METFHADVRKRMKKQIILMQKQIEGGAASEDPQIEITTTDATSAPDQPDQSGTEEVASEDAASAVADRLSDPAELAKFLADGAGTMEVTEMVEEEGEPDFSLATAEITSVVNQTEEPPVPV